MKRFVMNVIFAAAATTGSVPISAAVLSIEENGAKTRTFRVDADGADRITLELCLKSDRLQIVCAVASYQAHNGRIDSAADAPFKGSYRGVDPTGLFRSSDSAMAQSDLARQLLSNPDSNAMVAAYAGEQRTTASMLVQKAFTYDIQTQAVLETRSAVAGESYVLLKPKLQPPVGRVLLLTGCPAQENITTLTRMLADAGYAVMQRLPQRPNGHPSCHVDVARVAQLLAAFAGSEGAQGIDVLGVSSGGPVALWLAQRYPRWIKSVALVSSPSMDIAPLLGYQPFYTDNGQPLPHIRSGLAGLMARLQSGSQKERLITALHRANDEEVEHSTILRDCSIPLLALYGADDQQIDARWDAGRIGARCASARITIYEGVGHFALGPRRLPNGCHYDAVDAVPARDCEAEARASDAAIASLYEFWRTTAQPQAPHPTTIQ